LFEVLDANKNTDSPSQNVVGPLAVIVGTSGSGFTVTTVVADVLEGHPDCVATTV
jgi:hypothetical protein